MGGSYVPGDMGGDRINNFAGDQALPPGWASNTGGCPATIRIEYGPLRDVAEEVAAVTRGWRVPAGSVILLSSMTQLLGAGLGLYMADFCSIASWLDGIFMEKWSSFLVCHFYWKVLMPPCSSGRCRTWPAESLSSPATSRP